jgi:hypothetical protein
MSDSLKRRIRREMTIPSEVQGSVREIRKACREIRRLADEYRKTGFVEPFLLTEHTWIIERELGEIIKEVSG